MCYRLGALCAFKTGGEFQMRSKLALLLALAAVLFVFAACADTSGDIVGKVGQTPIYRWYYEAHLKKQLALYKLNYGVDLSEPAYKTEYKEYKENRLTDLVGITALKDTALKMGLFELSSEQEAEVDKKYLEYYNLAMSSFLSKHGTDEKGYRRAEQEYIDWLLANSLTPERVRSNIRDEYVLSLLYDSLGKARGATDEEIRAYYESQLITQREKAETEPGWFGENAPVPIYVPLGYVETARLTLGFNQQQMQEISTAADAAMKANVEYLEAVSSSGEDSTFANSKKNASSRLDKAFENVLERCYKQVEKRMEPILAQARSGEDFMELMRQKSEDKRMLRYFVCNSSSHVEESYRTAALALKTAGDISDPVRLEQGVCIIYLVERPEPGQRPLELVYDEIKKSISFTTNTTLDFELWNEYAKKAEDEGIVELYIDKL